MQQDWFYKLKSQTLREREKGYVLSGLNLKKILGLGARKTVRNN